jgi:DNA primase
VHHAIRAAGGLAAAADLSPQAWADRVRDEASDTVEPLVTELAVAPLPADSDESVARYAASVVLSMVELQITRQIGSLRSRVQRTGPEDPGHQEAFAELLAVEARRRTLRERIAGA